MIHVLSWTPDFAGDQIGTVDVLLDEHGLVLRGIRVTLAPNKSLEQVIEFPEHISVPGAGDRLVFYAQLVRSLDRYFAAQLEYERQALAVSTPATGTVQ